LLAITLAHQGRRRAHVDSHDFGQMRQRSAIARRSLRGSRITSHRDFVLAHVCVIRRGKHAAVAGDSGNDQPSHA
jgi:hypothetical protein